MSSFYRFLDYHFLLQLTSEIFGFVHGLWIRDLDLFAELSMVHSEEMGPAMDRANLACKSNGVYMNL